MILKNGTQGTTRFTGPVIKEFSYGPGLEKGSTEFLQLKNEFKDSSVLK